MILQSDPSFLLADIPNLHVDTTEILEPAKLLESFDATILAQLDAFFFDFLAPDGEPPYHGDDGTSSMGAQPILRAFLQLEQHLQCLRPKEVGLKSL